MTDPDPQVAPPETGLREAEQLSAAIEYALKYVQQGAAVQTMRVAVTSLMEAICVRPDTFLPDYILRRLARPDARREKVMAAIDGVDIADMRIAFASGWLKPTRLDSGGLQAVRDAIKAVAAAVLEGSA